MAKFITYIVSVIASWLICGLILKAVQLFEPMHRIYEKIGVADLKYFEYVVLAILVHFVVIACTPIYTNTVNNKLSKAADKINKE